MIVVRHCTGRRGVEWTRWERPIAVGLSALILAAGVVLFVTAATGEFGRFWGVDIAHYLDATRRWLATGTPYVPSEVAGPFTFVPETFLHPPIALVLFLPFLVLPLPLWWAIPLGVVAWSVRQAPPWAWPLLAFAVSHPRFHGALIVGNTDLWVAAGLVAGIRHGWPALVIAAKPSLAFLALVGIRRRSWWIGTVAVALACLPFGALWLDWVAVVRHAPGDWTYSLPSLPWLLAMGMAGLGAARVRSRQAPR